jgi:hypothetical protein
MPYTHEQFPVGTIVRVPRKDPGRWPFSMADPSKGSQHFVVIDSNLGYNGGFLYAEIWMRGLPEMEGPYFAREGDWPI